MSFIFWVMKLSGPSMDYSHTHAADKIACGSVKLYKVVFEVNQRQIVWELIQVAIGIFNYYKYMSYHGQGLKLG
jgi:hypothetical protein